jgi:hypothetical protein
MVRGAVAVSDNGTGTIVGWSFDYNGHSRVRAKAECLKKGGKHPKLVVIGS